MEILVGYGIRRRKGRGKNANTWEWLFLKHCHDKDHVGNNIKFNENNTSPTQNIHRGKQKLKEQVKEAIRSEWSPTNGELPSMELGMKVPWHKLSKILTLLTLTIPNPNRSQQTVIVQHCSWSDRR